MKKSARVLEKLVSPGLPGLQVATRLTWPTDVILNYWLHFHSRLCQLFLQKFCEMLSLCKHTMKAVLYNYVAVHVVDERKNLLVISGVCIQLPYFKISESFDVLYSCKCSLSRTFIVLLLSDLLCISKI